jgi:hypothetical protein
MWRRPDADDGCALSHATLKWRTGEFAQRGVLFRNPSNPALNRAASGRVAGLKTLSFMPRAA